MSRVVYIHVGAPKTGTTYLQDRLRINRNELAGHGVHYPLGLFASQFKAAVDLLDLRWQGGLREEAAGQWDTLMGKVGRLDGTVIISHEILASATPDKVERAMNDLKDSEVHIVYSARDLARQIPAEWQEGIKHRGRRRFRRFLRDVQADPRNPPKMWFWKVQGLPNVLSRWSHGLPPERVHLVTVPPPGGPRDELWRRFSEVFGIQEGWAPEDSHEVNPSIGMAETSLIRRLNQRLGKDTLEAEPYRDLVRHLLVHQTLARRKAMTRATLPPHAYPWAREVAEEWVDWVEGSGIHVVGDVDDLRPVPPEDPERWLDPDRPEEQEVLDAALDALVTMTQEAAARPDPDAYLTKKIGRAARRLRGQ